MNFRRSTIVTLSAAALTLLGVTVLLGWALGVGALTTVFPGMASMKPNTAATIMLCGIALGLVCSPSKFARRLVSLLALAIATMGILSLAEYLFGWNLPLDQILFHDSVAANTLYPGRMSPSTALCFGFAGSALLVASLGKSRRWRAPVLGALSASIALLGGMTLCGYFLDAAFRYHLWNYSGVAIHTATAFAILGGSLLTLLRREGGLNWFMDGSTTARICLGVASVLTVAMISNSYTYRLRESEDWVSHTQEVLKEIATVAVGAAELESAQRGYIILGDDRLLESRESTKLSIDTSVRTLLTLTADNSSQQIRLRELAPLIVKRNAWGDRTIAARSHGGFSEAEQLLALGDGIVLTESIRRSLHEMTSEEYRLLALRKNKSNNVSTTTFLLLPLGVFLSVMILSLVLFFLNAGVGERARTETILRQQASLLDLAPALVRDMDSRIVSWTSGMQKLYGYAPEEAIGQISHILLKTEFSEPLARIESTLATTGSWEGELEHRAKDGARIIVASQWVLYRDAHRNPIHILEVNNDVTARKHAEELQMRSQKLESLGTLTGGIAHDFNNILLAITGNVKFAIADLPPDHPVQYALAEISKAGARATDLVRRILTFGRHQETKRDALNLRPVIEEALRLVRATLPATIEFRTDFAPDLPPTLADSTQIHQIVVNLATNAAHAIGPRSGWIEFRLAGVRVDEELAVLSAKIQPGRYLRLDVTDSGCGMEKKVIDRIFDPFFTTKGLGGAGLGLSVVHGIVTGYGGAVAVYSELEKGTSFQLYFPVSTSAVTETVSAPVETRRGQNEHVLYVDDEPNLVDLVARTLKRLGYRVTGYEQPARALEAFRANPQTFDVVVTDLNMPGMSGFDFAAALFAVRPDIPVA
jgi:PAS domain S-box-containing protein